MSLVVYDRIGKKLMACHDLRILTYCCKLGKVLGPRNLMPNPKLGSVTNDLKQAVEDAKAGELEFKNSDTLVQAGIAKSDFEKSDVLNNIKCCLRMSVSQCELVMNAAVRHNRDFNIFIFQSKRTSTAKFL